MKGLSWLIIKRTILLAMLLMVSYSCYSAKRALLIGISDYPEHSGWNNIHGASDVRLLETDLITNGFLKSLFPHQS